MPTLRRFRTSLGFFMFLLVAFWQVTQPLNANTFYWDSDGTAVGNSVTGTGLGGTTNSWDTTNQRFWAPFAGSDTIWSNVTNANDTVIIQGGTAGTITLGTTISAGELVFNTTGYTVGSSTLTLSGAGTNPGLLTLGSGIAAATISSTLAGSNGLTFNGNGSGIMTLGGANTIAGTIRLNSGGITYTGSLSSVDAVTFGGTSTFRQAQAAGGTMNFGALSFLAGDGGFTTVKGTANTFTTFTSLAARGTGAVGLFVNNGGLTGTQTAATTITGQTGGEMGAGYFFSAGSSGPYTYAFYDTTQTAATVRALAYGTDANSSTQASGAAGITATGASNYAQITGSITGQGTATENTITFSGATVNLTMTAGALLTVQGLLQNNTAAATTVISGAASSATNVASITAGGSGELIIRTDVANDSMTLNAPIANTTGALTKSGLGTLTLAPNTYSSAVATGNTAVTVSAAAAANLFIGMTVSGVGIPAGTTISNISGTTVTLSAAPTLTNATALLQYGPSNAYTGTTYVNAGILTVDGPSALGASANIQLNGGSTQTVSSATQMQLLADGDGLGTRQNISFGQNVTVVGSSTLTVGKLSAAQALNKTIQLGNLTLGEDTLIVTANNGYGLEFTGSIALTGASNSTFNVTTATASNVVQALTLSGVISSTNVVGLTKQGAGTLVLNNANNSFGGTGALVDIQAGVLQVNSEGSMGNPNNTIGLDGGTLRVNYSTPAGSPSGRTYYLGATSTLEVTEGNSFEMSNAFGLPVAGNALTKSGAGTLVLSASNSTWTGNITIANGVLQVKGTNSSILGTGAGTITVAAITGAVIDSNQALQLVGGANVFNPLTLVGFASGTSSGVNFGGALESVSGSNTYSGVITLTVGGTIEIGVTGDSLTLAGGVTTATNDNLILNAGTGAVGNVNSAGLSLGTGTLTKIGGGQWNLNVANTFTGNVVVNAGTLALAGNAGALPATGTASITVQPGGTFVIDDTATHVANRIGTGIRAIALNGGAFTIKGNTGAATVETNSTGTLTLGSGGSTITLDATGNTVGGLQFNVGTLAVAATGETALLRGTNLGGTVGAGDANFVVTTPNLIGGGGAAGTTTMSIRPDIIGDATVGGSGTGFVTSVATTGFRVLASGELSSTLSTATSTTNMAFSSATALSTPTIAFGSLTLNTGGSLTGATNNVFTLGAAGGAGILALDTTSGNTISGPLISPAGPLFIHTVGNLTLNSGSMIFGTGSVTKADGGTLFLTGAQYYTSSTTINGGTLQLASGATNTLFFNNGLVVNNGGTLDLNGGTQYVGALSSQGAALGALVSGGNILSSSGAATLVLNSGAASFAGTIGGSNQINLVRSGSAATVSLLGAINLNGGSLLINGGLNTGTSANGTILADNGVLTNVSSIALNYGTLSLDNSRASGNTNRVPDAVTITMNGGSLNFYGRDGTSSAETLGPVVLNQGMSVISSVNHSFGASGALYSSDLTLSNLTRTTNAGSTVDFSQNYNGNSAGNLGLIGTNPRILITGFTTANANTNNIMGGWAIATYFFNTTQAEFASYNTTQGVGALNTAGFPGYDGTALVANLPAQNIRMTAGGAVTTGGSFVNSLNLASNQTAAVALTFTNAGDVLNLTSGGLLVQNVIASAGATSIGTAALPGVLTAGGAGATGNQDLYLYYYANGGAALTVNSQISDNGAAPVRLVAWGGDWGVGNIILANANNNYTGGTLVNAETLTIGATGKLPGGGLTIDGGTVTQTAGGVITSQAVTLNGGSTLNLNTTGTNNLSSITFNNNGGTATPTVAIATGVVLRLAGGGTLITVNSANVGTTATISGAGALDFANGTPTFLVNPITVTGTVNANGIYTGGSNVAPLQAVLNISALIQNSGLITKTGLGNIQMSSTTSTFTGGFSLSAGGLIIGASSSATGYAGLPTSTPFFATGPLGTGTLTIANGTSILSSAAANAILNALSVQGNFTYDGVNNVALNGAANLNGATRTITVNAPQMTATMLGVLSNGGVIKNGYGTLLLGNDNAITGVTVNNGTLIAQQPGGAVPTAAAPSPFGTGAVTYNGGSISFRTSTTDAAFNNNINVSSTLASANFDVQGANTVKMGTLNINMGPDPTTTTVNVTGTAGSVLAFANTSLGSNGVPASTARVAGQYETFNIGTGVTVVLGGGGLSNNNEPLNNGPGTLLYGGTNNFSQSPTISTSNAGAAPTANSTNAIYGSGNTVTLSGTNTYTIMPQMGTTLIAGTSTGGLQQQNTLVAAQSLSTAATFGNGVSGTNNGFRPNDALFDRVLHNSPVNDLGTYNGYLTITTAGTYNFITAADDLSSLVIDGVEVAREITTGKGIQDASRGGIVLSAGVHSITYKVNTGGTSGGDRLLYSGPDTAGNSTWNHWQALPSSALSYFTGPANASNNYYNAAQIDNDYVIAAGSTITWAGQGSDFNSTVKSLTMGNGATLAATNDQSGGATPGTGGIGFMGVKGVTTLGTGAIVSPTSGILYFIGGVNDSGNGLTKNGVGSLWLNNSTNFTGALAINAGTVVIWEANALTTGGTTVASGASLDLNGVTSSSGRNITLNGVGTLSQIGALYNSSATTAGVAGGITLNASSQIGGYGDITISGAVTSAAGVTLTKSASDTLTLTGNNASTLLGPVAITGGVLNNGALNSGVSNALGANTISVAASTILNLNGNGLAVGENVTINGSSLSNFGPNQGSLANLINTSVPLSVVTRNTVAAGSNMLLLPNTANTATIASNVIMANNSGIGSNTFTTGGDMIITGVVSGAFALSKSGGDTVFLRGVNTYSGGTTIQLGTLALDAGGVLNGAGGVITVNDGATLLLDNTATTVTSRINNGNTANNKNISLNGANLTIKGSSGATNITELFSASVTGGNTSGTLVNQGMNYINLTDNAAAGTGSIAVTSTRAGTGLDLTNANAGMLAIVAKNLGLSAVGTADSTNFILGTGSSTGALNIIGQNSNTAGGGSGVNVGVAPWALVDDGTNVNFLVFGATTTGVRALGSIAGEYVAANTNALVANDNTLINAATTTVGQTTISINSLKLASGGTLNMQQGTTMNIQSGGILATSSATISGPGIFSSSGTPNASTTAGTQNFYIWTYGSGTVLTINSSFGSANNNSGQNGEIDKAGLGTLVLGGFNFDISTMRIQEGTVQLNNSSAIYYRVGTAPSSAAVNSSTNQPTLQVNGTGVLDMNGFNLAAGNLASINPGAAQASQTGGSIINSAAGTTKTLSINNTASQTWSGNISTGAGVINFARYGNSTFTITNNNTYTGTTIIGGGATTLVDMGALRGTSSVTINDATLIWNDNGNQSDPYRLGATPAAVNMNGGGFQYNNRVGEAGVANIGSVSLLSGANAFLNTAAAVGSATTVINGTFSRSLGATVNFSGSVLGDDGNVIVNGTAPTLFNGIVGGWATTSAANPELAAGAGDFVTYDPVSGFRAIVDYKTTGGISYAAGQNLPAFGNAAFAVNTNIRVNSTVTMVAGNNVVNAFVIGSAATTTLSFANPTDTLFVQSGGILGSTDAVTKNLGGATAPTAVNLNGFITAGNTDGSAGPGNANYELFLTNLSTTLQVNSQIVDNGAHAVSLVISSGSINGPVIRLANTNTYTGTTTINSADVRLDNTFGLAISNSTNIIINSGTEAATDSGRQANGRLLWEASNQLNPNTTITLNGGIAGIDLNGFNQTLAQINITNAGGLTGNSAGLGVSVRTGVGNLTLTGGVNASNLTNTATIPFIAGTLILPTGQHNFSVAALGTGGAEAQIGLALNAFITGAGGIDKNGTGVLAITNQDTYTGATNVNQGTLVLGGFDQQGTPARITMGIPNSQVTVASGATVDLRGGTAYVGSVNGAGSITNSVYGITSNGSAGNVGTLFIGLDGTSTGNFSGTFTNFINGVNQSTGFGLNVTKLGSGTQTISGNNAAAQSSGNGFINNVGTLQLFEGGIKVTGANGTLGFTAINVASGGVLTLDDTTNNVANRLGGGALTGAVSYTGTQTSSTTITLTSVVGLTVGMPIFGPGLTSTTITAIAGNVITTAASTQTVGATNLTFYVGAPRTISMQGGTIAFNGGSNLINEGTNTANGVGNVTLSSGNSVWSYTGTGGGSVNLNALTAGAGTLFIDATGNKLGQGAAGPGNFDIYVNGGMNGQGSGSTSTGAAVNAVVGLVGGNFSGVGIRPDVTGTDLTGTGVVTYDVYGFRLLASTEYNQFPNQPNSPKVLAPTNAQNPPAGFAAVNPTVNVADPRFPGTTYTGNILATSQVAFTTNTTIASLRLDSGGGLISDGGAIANSFSALPMNYNPIGTLNTVTVSSGLIIANTGNVGFTGGAVTAAGATMNIATAADLAANTYLISTNTTNSFLKNGSAALNLNKNTFFGSNTVVGAITVNTGTLNLNAGPNTLTAINTNTASVVGTLTVNAGATVDLKGNDQAVGNISSADTSPGGGGVITNTSGTTANLYTNSNSTYGGSINGNINLWKSGANNLILASASTYTGITTIQGGILVLQDSGTLASTTYNLNGGQLRFDNRSTSLSDINPRIPASTSTINMRAGILMDLGGATGDAVNTYNTVNILQGLNMIREDSVANVSTRAMVFTNFNAPTAASGATVAFETGNGTLGQTGTNPSIVLPSTPTLIGNIIPWAISSTDQVAEYNASINPITGVAYGVAVPSVTGGSTTTAAYAGAFTTGVSGNNINQASTTTASSEAYTQLTRTFNSLRMSGTSATVLNANTIGNELIRVEAGVLISRQANLTIANGQLTAGPANNAAATMYLWPLSNTMTLSGQLVDNGTGALSISVNGSSNIAATSGTLALTQGLTGGLNATGAATTTTAGSNTVTLAAAPAAGAAPLVGDAIIGPGIPNGATITAVSGAVLTISAPAFATTSATTVSYGASRLETGTNAAVASGAVGTLAITVADGTKYYVGETVTGTGIPAGVTIASIAGNVITTTSFTASAAVAANQAFGYNGSTLVSTNSAYSGATIVNGGTLALNGAVGSRAINSVNGGLIINSGGAVTMTNAGQIAPNTDLTINGGGSLTFAPVTVASPATGGINALNSVTFVNNGGSGTPTLAGGTNGIITIRNGLITSTSDNQGTTPTVSGVLNFGMIALGTATTTTTIQVADVSGFMVGQTVTGLGITAGTTIGSITGNVLTLSGGTATLNATGAISTVNQAVGSTSAMTPTLNVSTSNPNNNSADLTISAVIANSSVGGAGIGGWSSIYSSTPGAALVKTGNGTLSLSGASTFDNGINLQQGTLVIGANATGTGFVTSGPLGVGILTISGGTTLMADASGSRSVANNIVVLGDFTFGGQQAGNNLNLSGNVALGSTLRTMTVTNPTVTETLSGSISGTAGLTKAGAGFLLLSGGNTLTGTITVAGGVLKVGNVNAIPTANANALVVNSGTEFDANAQTVTVGSLTGDSSTTGGLITNSGGAASLNIGTANTSTTFAGLITNGASALNIGKLGSGNLTLININTYIGNTTVNNGTLTLNSTGQIYANMNAQAPGGTIVINVGGTLTLDNSTTNVANRLGGNLVPMTLAGGTLNIVGSNSGALNENLGAVTVNGGLSTINVSPGSGGTNNLTMATYTYTSGTLFMSSTGASGTNGFGLSSPASGTANVTVVGTAPTLTNGILAYGTGNDGTNQGFLTYDAVKGFRVVTQAELTALTQTTEPVLPAQTGVTFGLNSTNIGTAITNNVVSSTLNITQDTLTNSLTLTSGGGLLVNGGNLVTGAGSLVNANGHLYATDGTLAQVTVTSGGIIAQTGNTGITNGALAASTANASIYLHTQGNLNVNSYVLINGTGGLVKDGAGTLTLGKTDFMTGGLSINQGNVILNSGNANTIVVTPTITVATLNNLNLMSGSLDLNGKNQAFALISGSSSNQGGLAGNLLNTGALANLFTSTATSSTFNGQITGALNLYKAGAGVLTLTQSNNLSGGTVNVQGGGITLKDTGSITGVAQINVTGAALVLDDTGLAVNNNRLNGAAITSRSGEIKVNGQIQSTAEAVTLSSLTLDSGQTNLGLGTGGTNGAAVALTISNFSRNATNGATLMVFPLGSANTGLGRVNANAGANGLASSIVFTNGAPSVTANIIGAWATANGTDWLTYAATPVAQTPSAFGRTGLGLLGDTTSGFADYDFNGANNFTTNTVVGGYSGAYQPNANANVKITGQTTALVAVPVVAGVFVANTINLQSTAAAGGLSFTTNTDTMNLTAGGIMHSGNFTESIGSAAGNGNITVGGATPSGNYDLFVYNNQGTMTINSKIIDNGSSKVRLIYNGYAPNNASLSLTAANGYTGGTIVSGTGTGAVTLNGAASTVVIPAGGVTLNNSNMTMVTNGGQIAATNAITLNDGSNLTLVGANTLDSLVFSNKGGTATPTVAVGTTSLTLTNTNAITVTNDNYATTPTISGTALTLASGSTVSVSGLSPEGLSITVTTLTAANLTKTGNSSLILSVANAGVTGNFTLADGSLILNSATAIGTSTLILGNGTSTVPLQILSGTAATTIANNVTVNQDFTFGGTVAANSLTITGTTNLGAVGRTITVTNPTVTGTLGGVISGTATAGTAGLTKAGDGTLVIGQAAANTYTGDTYVTAGLLKLGAASVNAIPDASNLFVYSPATFDIAGRNEQVASIAGEDSTHAGLITNSSATAATLTVSGSTSTTYAGVISQGASALSLTKAGSSILTLTGANTYNGATAVQGGGLIVNGSLANTGVTISSGAFLGGTGTIGVTNNAITTNTGGSVLVSSGGAIDLRDNVIGVLTIQGNSGSTALNMAGGNTLSIDTSTNSVDSILIGNNAKVSIASVLTVNLNGLGGTLADGVYNIINYASGNGAGLLATLGNPGSSVVTGTNTSNGSAIKYNVAAGALQLIVGNSANYFWNGDQSNSWSTNNAGNTNFDIDSTSGIDAGQLPGIADTVIFSTNVATNQTPTVLGTNFSINGLQFGVGANLTGSASIDTGNNNLTLNAAGIIMNSGSAANSIVSTGTGGIILQATQAWTDNSIANLTVSAPVSGTGGLIINGTGTGKVILSGNNSYSNASGTVVQSTATGSTATLQLGSTTALGATSNPVTVNGDNGALGRGVLDLNGNNTTVGGIIGSAGATSAGNGSITSSTAATLTANQSITTTYGGTIDGAIVLVKTGTGTLDLILPSTLAASTYTGGTTVNGGTLLVGNGTVTNENGGAFGTGLVAVNSGGTLQFNNGLKTNTTNFANNFTFNGGTVLVQTNGGNTRLGTGAGAIITIAAGGATIQANGAGGGDDITLAGVLTGSGAITVNNGGGSWVRFSNPDGTAVAPTYTGTVTVAPGTNTITMTTGSNGTALAGAAVVNNSTAASGINFDSGINNVTFGSLAGTGAFAMTTQATAGAVNITTGGNNTTTTYTGVISAGSVTGGKITKVGTGTFNLNATNTYTGGLTVSNGTVMTNNAQGFGTNASTLTLGDANTAGANVSAFVTAAVTEVSPIVVTSSATAGAGTATLGTVGVVAGNFSGGITLNKDLNLTATSGGSLTLSTGAVTAGSAGTFTLNANGPGNITFTSAITSTATNVVALTVNEGALAGVVTLNGTAGATTYFGTTQITTGTLASGANNTMSANSTVNLANSGSAALNLTATTAGSTQSIGALSGGGASGGNVTLGAATSNLSIGNNNTTTTYAGVIAGLGNLQKVGSGTQTLTGNSNYSGSTAVSGTGALVVNGQLASTSAVTVSGTATLQVGTAGVGSIVPPAPVSVSAAAGTPGTASGVNAQNVAVINQNVVNGPALAGTGSVTGTVTLGGGGNVGVIRPGDTLGAGFGKLTVGALTVSDGSQLQLSLNPGGSGQNDLAFDAAAAGGATAATYLAGGTHYTSIWSTPSGNYDTIKVAGSLILGGNVASTPTILVTGNPNPGYGDIYKLLDWSNVGVSNSIAGGGNFDVTKDLVLPTLSPGMSYDTSAFTTYGVVVVVPEPGRVLLLLMGLLAFGLRRRRRD